MTIQGISREEYQKLFSAGGEHTVVLDRSDISADGSFEEFSLIKPYLDTGFEIEPTPSITEPSMIAALSVYGDDWTQIVARVYIKGGKVIYRRLENLRYEAKITVPAV